MSYSLQGLAAENLVIADLCKQGYFSFLSAAGMRYDLVADISDRLIRIQVKSCEKITIQPGHKHPTYYFNLARKNKQRTIKASEVDLVALVAMDTGQIAYLPPQECEGKGSIKLRPPSAPDNAWTKKDNRIESLTLQKALKEIL